MLRAQWAAYCEWSRRLTDIVRRTIAARRLREVPYFRQSRPDECGLTCIRMVLASYGRYYQPDDLRETLAPEHDGTTARDLLQVARAHALHVQSHVGLDLKALSWVPPPVILHWDFTHFVVADRISCLRGTRLLDPIDGRRWVRASTLSRSFTGVALSFAGSPAEPAVPPVRAFAWRALLVREWRSVSVVVLLALLSPLLIVTIAIVLNAIVDEALAAGVVRPRLITAALIVAAGAASALCTCARSTVVSGLVSRTDPTSFRAFCQRLRTSIRRPRAAAPLLATVSGSAGFATVNEHPALLTLSAWIETGITLFTSVAATALMPSLWVLIPVSAVPAMLHVRAARAMPRAALEAYDADLRLRTAISGVMAESTVSWDPRLIASWYSASVAMLGRTMTRDRRSARAEAVRGVLAPIAIAAASALTVADVAFSGVTVGGIAAAAVVTAYWTTTLTAQATAWRLQQQSAENVARLRLHGYGNGAGPALAQTGSENS